MAHHIFNPIKVTAIFPDDLIIDVQKYTEGKYHGFSPESFSGMGKICQRKKLNDKLRKQPLQFPNGFTAENVRKTNRSY